MDSPSGRPGPRPGAAIDASEFERLYAECRASVFGYIRARSRNDGDADDIAQDAELLAWTHTGRYDGRPFCGFVFYWAHIALMRFYRAGKRRWEVEVLMTDMESGILDAPSEQEKLEYRAWLEQESRAIAQESSRERFEMLLRIAFTAPFPPHQLIVFGLTKLVCLRPGDKPVKRNKRSRAAASRTPPRRVVSEFSDVPLRDLEREFEDAYLRDSSLPEEYARACFEPLRQRLEATKELPAEDPVESRPPGRLLGETTLREYYGSDPTQDISHWWYSVYRHVASRLGEDVKPGARKKSRKRKKDGGA